MAVLPIAALVAGVVTAPGATAAHDGAQQARPAAKAQPAAARQHPRGPRIPNPTVSEPIAQGLVGGEDRDYPMAAADPVWLSTHGYVQEEYYVSGTANCYTAPALATGSVTDRDNPYTTRIMVRRPLDPSRANGVVAVEWLNASSGYEIDSTWSGAGYESYVRAGATWVGVSVQNNVVQFLKQWSPERYGSLNVLPDGPDDCPVPADAVNLEDVRINGLGYDIMSQVGQALKSPVGVDPLRGLPRHTMIATGASQSAARLVPYVNSVHPISPIYNGFFLAIPVFDHVIRQDELFARQNVKVFKVLSEFDVVRSTVESRTQPDSPTLRAWEVAGAPHTTYTNVQYRIPNNARDGLPPIVLSCPDLPEGTQPLSRIPSRYVFGAAASHLVKWIRHDTPPPASRLLETEPGTSNILRDEAGNALGGIRLAQHDVPTATNDGGIVCGTYGTHRPFDQATLGALYPSAAAYVNQVSRVTDQLVREGYLLRPDARTTVLEARQFGVGPRPGQGAAPSRI